MYSVELYPRVATLYLQSMHQSPQPQRIHRQSRINPGVTYAVETIPSPPGMIRDAVLAQHHSRTPIGGTRSYVRR